MAVMVVCAALLAAGLVAGLGRQRPFRSPPVEPRLPPWEVARRFLWYVAVAAISGSLAGITIIGAGGRLAMRLLAVTGGDDAQGRITEAEEVVGQISVGGTFSFILFNGIFGGVGAAVLYLLTRRLLPAGLLGGAIFGAGLLVLFGTTLDPLRDENPDFDIVGPGWLAVVVFALLAVAFGSVLAGFTARCSAWLPLPSTSPRVLVRYAWPALVAVFAFSITIVLAAVCGAVVVATRWDGLVAVVRSPRAVLVGRVVLGALALAALPGAVTSIAHIVDR